GPLRGTLTGYRHFLLVGNTPDALEIARAIEANDSSGQRLAGFALVGRPSGVGAAGSKAQPRAEVDQSGLRRAYPVYALAQLPELLRQHVIDEVIFAVSKDDLDRLEETFLACEEEGVRTRVLVSFFPHVISKVYLERLNEMPLLTFS